jgi:hypothetical protein
VLVRVIVILLFGLGRPPLSKLKLIGVNVTPFGASAVSGVLVAGLAIGVTHPTAALALTLVAVTHTKTVLRQAIASFCANRTTDWALSKNPREAKVLVRAKRGTATAARIPMITITEISSARVKPRIMQLRWYINLPAAIFGHI